jgi:hypothetical protein
MALRIRKTIGALVIAVLVGLALLGVGCGDDGSERAVEWGLAPPVGPNWVRLSAPIEGCNRSLPLLDEPIIESEGNRVYIELRHTPDDDKGGCALNLPIAFKKITFERSLDELVLFDASTDPPEQRWPTKGPLPTE